MNRSMVIGQDGLLHIGVVSRLDGLSVLLEVRNCAASACFPAWAVVAEPRSTLSAYNRELITQEMEFCRSRDWVVVKRHSMSCYGHGG
jgi:hypothetical protein